MIVKNASTKSKIVQNDPNWSKVVQRSPKFSKNVNSLKYFNMAKLSLHGSKGSNMLRSDQLW